MLCPLEQITFDNHAIRHGEPAAGYIVILHVSEDETIVCNTIYPTQLDAVKSAGECHPALHPVVKALRAMSKERSYDSPEPSARGHA